MSERLRAAAVLTVAACAAAVAAAVPASASPAIPGPVTGARVDSTSTSAARLVWRTPSGSAVRKVIVRIADGTTAPASAVRGGRGVALGRTARTITFHHLVPGRDYSFAIFTSDGRGHVSRRVALHGATVPRPVTAPRSSVTPAAVTLGWTQPAGGVYRTIVRYTRSTTPPATPRRGTGVAAKHVRATGATVAGLPPGTRYVFSVFRLNRYGAYVRGVPVRVATAPPPGSVAYPVAAPAGPRSVRLTWTPPAGSGDTAVVVRRTTGSTPPAAPTSGTKVADVAATKATLVDGALPRTGTYAYSLFTHDRAGHYARRATTVVRTDARSVAAPALQGRVGGPASSGPATVRATDSDGRVVTARPDADGYWTIADVHPGLAYSVCVSAGTPSNRPVTACRGADVTPGREQTSRGLDLTVPATGTVSAHVQAGTGSADAATVRLYRPAALDGEAVATADVSAAGTATVADLATGDYVVCVDGRAAELLSSCGGVPWQPGQDIPRKAVASTVPAGGTVAASATLAPAAAVAGQVTTGTSDRSGVVVTARDVRTGTVHATATTGVDGRYRLRGLDPSGSGDVVCFDASSLGRQSVCDAGVPWNPRTPASTDTPVPVTAAQTTTVDVDLAAGASLAGTVRARATGLGGARVVVFDSDAQQVATTTTDATGTYRVTGLTASADGYRVCADPAAATPAAATGYVRTCSGAAPWPSTSRPPGDADPVPLAAGQARTGVDVTVPVGTRFTGVVHSASSTRTLPNVRVIVIDPSDRTARGVAVTAADGSFSVGGLPARTYQVCFDASHSRLSALGYLDTCWRGVPWGGVVTSVPDRVPLLDVTTTRPLDVGIPLAGAVAGKVTGAGKPLDGATVQLYTPGGVETGPTVPTAADGTYLVPDLVAGSYVACVDTSTGRQASTGYLSTCQGSTTWVPGADPPVHGATAVVVPVGRASSVVRTSLAVAGSIAAWVTDRTGAAVPGVGITIARGGVEFAQLTGDGTGSARVPGLPTGTYTVCVDPAGVVTAAAPTGLLATCRTATVTAGKTTPLTVVAPSAGAVAGTVVAAEDGAPLVGVQVYVYDDDGDEVGATTTGTDGRYAVVGLSATADARVCFYVGSPATGGVERGSQCWRGVAWDGGYSVPAGATRVRPTVGTTRTGVDATLAPADVAPAVVR